jgi:hypothetical protein
MLLGSFDTTNNLKTDKSIRETMSASPLMEFFPSGKIYGRDQKKAKLLWQEPQGSVELTKLLPRSHSASSRWGQPWLPDRRFTHLWYVTKDIS